MSQNADYEQEENKRFSGKLRHTSGGVADSNRGD